MHLKYVNDTHIGISGILYELWYMKSEYYILGIIYEALKKIPLRYTIWREII